MLSLVSTLAEFLCSGLGVFWVLLALAPTVTAAPPDPFPNILFSDFAEFVTSNFASDISLSTILALLFTLTENPELINLHGQQQHSKIGNEYHSRVTSWVNMLSRVLLATRLREERRYKVEMNRNW